MTNVVKSVSINGQVVPFGGGGSEGQEVVYLTQAEYDALPASKLTDGKIYKIKTSGVAPTPGGGTAIERGDMVMTPVTGSSDTEGFFVAPGQDTYIYICNKYGVHSFGIRFINSLGYRVINNGYIYYGINNTFHKTELSTQTHSEINVDIPGNSTKKWANGYMYYKSSTTTTVKKVDTNMNITDSTEEEYNAIPSGLYYKGLYYSQDGNDYVAVDSTGVEVKRYSNIGVVNGIYNDKLYRNSQPNDFTASYQAYAIATL